MTNWKPLAGPYEVSDTGEIRHARTGRVRKPKRSPQGYLQVTLWVDGRFVYEYVHRAVLKTFVGPCPPGMETRHLDGDPANNRLTNLQWGTPAENSSDTRRHNRFATGERNGQAKLTSQQREAVLRASGLHREIAARYGITRQRVGQIKTEGCLARVL